MDRLRNDWWVSRLGTLAGTSVHVYAGSSVPGLQNLADSGMHVVLSPNQLTQIVSAFALLGIFRLAVRWLLKLLSPGKSAEATKPTRRQVAAGVNIHLADKVRI